MGNVAYCRLHFLTVTPKLQLQCQFVPKEQDSLLASEPGKSEDKVDLKNKMKHSPFHCVSGLKEKKIQNQTKPYADETEDQKTKTLISESPPLNNKLSLAIL